ncbi:DNA mismatch repair endonuclease MutL [Ignavigranum ruoffiae]|uniref:DNA mismatch repair endonuclease MutL n=1 Tax=Ignavigranum ruoffiae TaxID=89093 RepID=UPI00205D4987|nr:DNA mismatch repair endonuclease MutL [Ignavigranum ruoffiae]UPQ85611.1 DNA mismatch repair endonuclease MutL [Ignavigranum ruoffiae]
MTKIRIMPESLANQIAAGEVVERPASVVKELVENSIDAGASHIIIEIEEAGISLIKVSDDGQGMDASDLELAFVPHATSKIFNPHDLFAIHSLGFRGEALASIGSVAKVYLESKTSDQLTGSFIQIEGSKILDQGQAKSRQGTSMTVRSLFYNTPARLKHLKSLNTELRHILSFIQEIALAYPEIKFTLISDQHQIFQSIGNGDQQQAIASVYKPAIARDLIKIHAADKDFSIQGYLSSPKLTRTNMSYIHWIVNGRPVRSRMLSEVLVRAYGRQLMIGRYPIAVIHIQLDPRLVDVNVHPTKQTIRLSLEDELASLLTQEVQRAIQAQNPVPEINQEDLPAQSATMTYQDNSLIQEALDFNYQARNNAEKSMVSKVSRDHDRIIPPELSAHDHRPIERPVSEDTSATITEQPQAETVNFYDLHYVGQIHGTYLLATSAGGFYLIDQHAAQEKIRYEQFMKADYPLEQQYLLMPIHLQVSLAQEEFILESLAKLESLGINLQAFGPQSFQLESYPLWLDAEDLSRQVLDLCEFIEKHPQAGIKDVIESALIMKSCRGAIKANHYLSDQEAVQLIQDLAELDDPYHCPHGRPVLIYISLQQLEKWFKRIQDSHTSRLDAQF